MTMTSQEQLKTRTRKALSRCLLWKQNGPNGQPAAPFNSSRKLRASHRHVLPECQGHQVAYSLGTAPRVCKGATVFPHSANGLGNLAAGSSYVPCRCHVCVCVCVQCDPHGPINEVGVGAVCPGLGDT